MFLKLWSTRLNQSIYKPCGFRSFRPLRKRSMSMPSVLRSSTPASPKTYFPAKDIRFTSVRETDAKLGHSGQYRARTAAWFRLNTYLGLGLRFGKKLS